MRIPKPHRATPERGEKRRRRRDLPLLLIQVPRKRREEKEKEKGNGVLEATASFFFVGDGRWLAFGECGDRLQFATSLPLA